MQMTHPPDIINQNINKYAGAKLAGGEEMNKPKLCPFCGGEAEESFAGGGNIACSNNDCQAGMLMLYPNIWNTRPIEDNLLSQLAERDALIERLVEAVENIRDLARTGTAPDAFGFTSEAQWNEYKVIKIARESNALVSEYQAMKGGDE